jgi:hypothetical protein
MVRTIFDSDVERRDETAASLAEQKCDLAGSDPAMLWQALEDRALRRPERKLLDAIAAGGLELAVITELDQHWVTLRLARPVGRFRHGELRCPPLAVRKLECTGSQPAG